MEWRDHVARDTHVLDMDELFGKHQGARYNSTMIRSALLVKKCSVVARTLPVQVGTLQMLGGPRYPHEDDPHQKGGFSVALLMAGSWEGDDNWFQLPVSLTFFQSQRSTPCIHPFGGAWNVVLEGMGKHPPDLKKSRKECRRLTSSCIQQARSLGNA